MFGPFERMVAFRYLRARRKEGFISVIAGFSLLGIGLGVATLIVVMAVMNGFRQELLTRILGINGHLGVYASSPVMSGYDDLAARIRAMPGVVLAAPTIEGQVMATVRSVSSGAMVRGVNPNELLSRASIVKGLKGDMDSFKAGTGIIIGRRLAEKMGVGVGDQITLISPKGLVTAFGTVPRVRAFTVDGTFEVGMFEYDSSFIFMPLDAAQTYFQMTAQVNMVEVFLQNPDQVNGIA